MYAKRGALVDQRRYTPFDPAHLLLHHSRERAFLNLMKLSDTFSLEGRRVLEIGCGAGGILIEYLNYGACAMNLFGVDVLPDKLAIGRERSSNLGLVCASGEMLPFADGAFDIVTQYTALTSVLDMNIRMRISSEMLRVVSRTGLIVSYDFLCNNPKNPDVRGLTIKDLKVLFPNCTLRVQRIVLAPPIARLLAPFSPTVCSLLEKIPWLCTHYMVGIRPRA